MLGKKNPAHVDACTGHKEKGTSRMEEYASLPETASSRGGRHSRDKGNRIEREIVERHKSLGVHAKRYPLSGAVYVCLTNKLLKTTGNVSADHKVRYRASRRDCRVCPLKPQCSPNTPSRKITRDVHEDARDHARSFVGTPEFEQSRDERKRVEMRFAHLKTHHRFERMRLRGLSGARDEFHLAAIVQNLKTLASQLWQPPPDALAASAL
jgi:hypothetical protein